MFVYVVGGIVAVMVLYSMYYAKKIFKDIDKMKEEGDREEDLAIYNLYRQKLIEEIPDFEKNGYEFVCTSTTKYKKGVFSNTTYFYNYFLIFREHSRSFYLASANKEKEMITGITELTWDEVKRLKISSVKGSVSISFKTEKIKDHVDLRINEFNYFIDNELELVYCQQKPYAAFLEYLKQTKLME